MTPKIGSIKNKKKELEESRGSQMTPKIESTKNKKKELGKLGGHKWPLKLEVSKIRKKLFVVYWQYNNIMIIYCISNDI